MIDAVARRLRAHRGAWLIGQMCWLGGFLASAQTDSVTAIEPFVCREDDCSMAMAYTLSTAQIEELALAFEVKGWRVGIVTDSAFVVHRELMPAVNRYGYSRRDVNPLAKSGPVIVRAIVRWRPTRYRVDLLELLQYNAKAVDTYATILDVPATDELESTYTTTVASSMADGGFSPKDVAWADYLSNYLTDAFTVDPPYLEGDW